MEIIHELEVEARGLYCGALGWIRPGGDFRFSVPIRSLLVDKAGTARLNVGSGVVHDSIPESEWAECHLKSRFLTALPKGLRLIETLRYTPGPNPFPLRGRTPGTDEGLGGHLRLPSTRWRSGNCSTACMPKKPCASASPWGPTATSRWSRRAWPWVPPRPGRASCFSPAHLQPRAALPPQNHRPPLYDEELARVMALGHFDAVFLNEKDQLTEGARSNLFGERGGILLTPPLEAVGIERRPAPASAQRRKGPRSPSGLDDLRDAEAIFMGNGLRGLLRVRLETAEQASLA